MICDGPADASLPSRDFSPERFDFVVSDDDWWDFRCAETARSIG